jgi:non-ribosomal peptide synthetase component F
LLQQVRDNVLSAQEHDIYPFDRVIEDLKIKKGPGRSFLFDVMVHMQEEAIRPGSTADFKDILIEPLEITRVTSKFDLTFSFKKDTATGAVNGSIVYNRQLFDASSIEKMSRDYLTLLSAITDDPSISARDLKKQFSGVGMQNDIRENILGAISSDY